MTKKQIKEIIKKINSISSNNVYYLKDQVEKFLDRLIRENGEEETREIREEIITNVIRKVENKQKEIPTAMHGFYVDLSELQEKRGELKQAEETLEKVLGDGKTAQQWLTRKVHANIIQKTQYFRALYRYNILKYKTDEQSEEETLDIVQKIAELDSNNELGLGKEPTAYEIFVREFSKKVPITVLMEEIFPTLKNGNGSRRPRPGEPKPPRKPKDYDEELSPEKRVEFIAKNFNVEDIYLGQNKFEGFGIFAIEGTDLVIAEKFGDVTTNQKAATYILPKESIFELVNLSRTEIKKQGKDDSRIQPVSHAKHYYNNLKAYFNGAVGYEYFKGVKPKTKKQNGKGKENKPEEDIMTQKNLEESRAEALSGKTFEELEEICKGLRTKLEEQKALLKQTTSDREAASKIEEELRRTMEELGLANKVLDDMIIGE